MRILLAVALVLLAGCATLRGIFSGDATTKHVCVVTAACNARDAETYNADTCIKRGNQKDREARLVEDALAKLKAKACADPRAWASCWNDATPCDP